jgi:glucose/arabinose dehydrogenase
VADDERVPGVVLDLGVLAPGDHVVDGEWIELESPADVSHFSRVELGDVEPQPAAAPDVGQQGRIDLHGLGGAFGNVEQALHGPDYRPATRLGTVFPGPLPRISSGIMRPMTGGGDPWEGVGAGAPDAGGGGLLSVANLPYLIVIVVSVASLVGFLVVTNPFAPEVSAVPTTATPTTSAAPSNTTTTSGARETTTTAGPTTTIPAGELAGIDLDLITDSLSYPVGAWSIPGDDRIFVIERGGRVSAIDASGARTTYLDLTGRVNSGGIENGLLGLAFHPDFADNGRLYVYYTRAEDGDDSPDSRISQFRAATADASSVDTSTEVVVLDVEQEGIRHRAGMLQFGPDGYLWIALGDGGLGDYSAQDLESYQGSILRIDVDSGNPYSIPPDNPGGDGLPEIWAHGLRNPWRFYIDATDGLIYIGDVGQAGVEEINVAPLSEAGIDYGWPNFEGDNCYHPTDGCDMGGWLGPVVGYDHSDGECSVTGGLVYRGTAIPELVGHYFYADWCSGFIRSFRYADGEATKERDWSSDIAHLGTLQIASFGWDGANELLVVDSNGALYRVVPVR